MYCLEDFEFKYKFEDELNKRINNLLNIETSLDHDDYVVTLKISHKEFEKRINTRDAFPETEDKYEHLRTLCQKLSNELIIEACGYVNGLDRRRF